MIKITDIEKTIEEEKIDFLNRAIKIIKNKQIRLIAKQLLIKNVNLLDIMEVTELTSDEIRSIAKKVSVKLNEVTQQELILDTVNKEIKKIHEDCSLRVAEIMLEEKEELLKIMKYTGLTREEISNLNTELQN